MYTACFCEENIWHLCRRVEMDSGAATPPVTEPTTNSIFEADVVAASSSRSSSISCVDTSSSVSGVGGSGDACTHPGTSHTEVLESSMAALALDAPSAVAPVPAGLCAPLPAAAVSLMSRQPTLRTQTQQPPPTQSSQQSSRSRVLVISSKARATPLWHQKSARSRNDSVLWDYHVVLEQHGLIYDYDTTLPFPCPLEHYVEQTFCPGMDLPQEHMQVR
jgi:hypothetical protein